MEKEPGLALIHFVAAEMEGWPLQVAAVLLRCSHLCTPDASVAHVAAQLMLNHVDNNPPALTTPT